MIKTLKYILLLFFIITVNAQEMSTISGFVRDDATGEPISYACLLYTSPSPRDKRQSRMPSSA